MRSHAKAPSAGSTLGQAVGLVSGRRAFATRCASRDADGSGALTIQLSLAFLGAFALLLACGAANASAVGTYAPGTPASICTGTGVNGGECGELRTVAVDSSNGQIYVADNGNSRVNQFAPDGSFVRAFGADVVASGQHDNGTTNPEVCEPASSTPADVCKKGIATASVAGAFGNPIRGMAVDPTTHVVYVASAVSRVAYFDGTTGAFLGQTEGTASNAPSANVGAPEKFAQLAGLAIDTVTAGGPYLYVAINPGSISNFKSKIDKFTTSATGLTATSYICQITGTAAPSSVNNTECGGNGLASHKDGAFEGLLIGTSSVGAAQTGGNLTVAGDGNLFIAEGPAASGVAARHVVSVFDQNGDYATQFQPSGGSPPLSGTEPRPEALAALPSGNILVAAGGSGAGQGGGNGGNRVQEYDLSTISPAIPPAIATATPVLEFGFGTIGGSLGVASNGTDAFVADRIHKKIWKYTQVPAAPDVTTEAATAISKFKAILHGRVTPSFANVSDCHFEYGTTTAYGSTAPCVPASPGSGNGSVAVSAKVSGLTFGTTYHFRLVATNSVGTTNGADLQFTTSLTNPPEVITTPGATQIAQSTANVAGKVNPNEVAVTDCHFNYGTTTSYGQTAPCVPSPGSGDSLVDVSASLSSLTPNTTYHFQLEATNGDGTSKGSDQQFKTLPEKPAISEESAFDVGQVAAKISAKVDPNESAVTACRIEYGTTTAYGSQQACVPMPGSGSSPVNVSASLAGLSPATTYHYRVVATNGGGTTEGPDRTFATLAPLAPTVATETASAGAADHLRILHGQVNPNGIAVADCRFEYGLDLQYGASTPCVPSAAGVGGGSAEVSVSASTEPLEPNTTYHFRLVASNVRGTSQGEDLVFKTGPAPADSCPNAEIRAAQGIGTMLLPACMALEMVSPSQKGNQLARQPSSISPDGSRLAFNSYAPLDPDVPNLNGITGDIFLGVRGADGWDVTGANLPYGTGNGERQFSFNPELTSWLQLIRPDDGLKFVREAPDHSFEELSPPLQNLTGNGQPLFLGASEDQSHVYFSPQDVDPRSGSFLSGDPIPAGAGEDNNLYVSHRDDGTPQLALAARDLNGKVWGGACGARLGGGEALVGGNLNLRNGHRTQGAISADGSRVYFSTRPAQPASGDCTEANKKRIMVREETQSGPVIEELIASECDRVTPACSTVDGEDAYQGASVDQSKVYFTTTRQLADTDLDSGAAPCSISSAVAGCDLYLYDSEMPAGERLTQVSAGDGTGPTPGSEARVYNAITAISADGSRVYFVATGVVTTDPGPKGNSAVPGQPNLYTWEAESGEIEFIGTLSGADQGWLWGAHSTWNNYAYPVPALGRNAEGKEVGGDGHVLLFKSSAALSADDDDGGFRDLFRYDAESGELLRVSKGAPGGSDNGNASVTVEAFGIQNLWAGTDYATRGRPISEDGETIEVVTEEGLAPGDVNGVEDVYVWREGQVHRVPGSSRATKTPANLSALSADGSTLAFHTVRQLVAVDGDSALDVYVARVGGGFPEPVAAAARCGGEACQGEASPAPAPASVPSGSLASPGNVKEAPRRRCPKGKKRVRRRGKVRCVRRAGQLKKASSKRRRAGDKQGGQR